jgi:hypothetical protein
MEEKKRTLMSGGRAWKKVDGCCDSLNDPYLVPTYPPYLTWPKVSPVYSSSSYPKTPYIPLPTTAIYRIHTIQHSYAFFACLPITDSVSRAAQFSPSSSTSTSILLDTPNMVLYHHGQHITRDHTIDTRNVDQQQNTGR